MNYIELTNLHRKGKVKSAYIVPTKNPGQWGVVLIMNNGKKEVLTKKNTPLEEKPFSKIESAKNELKKIGFMNATLVFENEKSLDS